MALEGYAKAAAKTGFVWGARNWNVTNAPPAFMAKQDGQGKLANH